MLSVYQSRKRDGEASGVKMYATTLIIGYASNTRTQPTIAAVKVCFADCIFAGFPEEAENFKPAKMI